MADQASTATSKVKESAVLTEASLKVLANEIGGEKVNGLVFCMYLNIPTTTIVHAVNSASELGLIDASDSRKIDVTSELLRTWKGLRAGSKEKEKVRDLERALREIGKPDMADVINDKHANAVELTADAFSS